MINERDMPITQLDHLPRIPTQHFNLYFYAAVLHTIMSIVEILDDLDMTFERFPFLAEYFTELALNGLDGIPFTEASSRWFEFIHEWESDAPPLPLVLVREASGLDDNTLTLLLITGLVEEDQRFSAVFNMLSNQPVPTLGMLSAWYGSLGDIRTMSHQLCDSGLLRVLNPDMPRADWILQPVSSVWDALRGQYSSAQSVRYRSPETLLDTADLILPDEIHEALSRLSSWGQSDHARAIVVRGPHHNGRRTLLGAVARSQGKGLLEVIESDKNLNWSSLSVLATALNALLVFVIQAAPSETVEIPLLAGYCGLFGVVMGVSGGLHGLEEAVVINLQMPSVSLRRACWSQIKPTFRHIEAISQRFRLPTGAIFALAKLAQSQAVLKERQTPSGADFLGASRLLNHQVLDTLATFVEVHGDWTQFAGSAETLADLKMLESRCRHREALREQVNTTLQSQMNCGVRALFTGPSGTGKSLAARQLASVIGLDLYRVDLSAVVNKYIGETEKNLERVFSAAESLNVILLLDEGDSLLTQRTDVQSSNDRYANLETNYLLQRIESFDGILIITTNSASRIDSAFQRRMDFVLDFHAPEAEERMAIWRIHMPENHQVEQDFLLEASARCILTGGQIRNVMLHASLLALEVGGVLKSSHIEAGLQREYRKLGQLYPLRQR